MWDKSRGDFSQVQAAMIAIKSQIYNKRCAILCEIGKNGVHFQLEHVSYLIYPMASYGAEFCHKLEW
jgi:hypothetical protein